MKNKGNLRVVFPLLVSFGLSLVFSACGGGGGRGQAVLPPPPVNKGNDGGPAGYPIHYTTDLDGIWWVDAFDIRISDPHGLLLSSDPHELEVSLEEGFTEIRNGRFVEPTLPYDVQLTENRVSRISEFQYEMVEKGYGTMVIEGVQVTIRVELIGSVWANTSRNQLNGSFRFDYIVSGGGQVSEAVFTFDCILTRASTPSP